MNPAGVRHARSGRVRWLGLTLLLGATGLALPAAASTALGLTIGALTRHSDRVVLARVDRVASSRTGARRVLCTFTRLRVLRDLAGGGAPRIVVRQLGGRAGGEVFRVEGDARFRVGETVVVFLRRDRRRAGLYHLTALGEAKFTVVAAGGRMVAIRDLAGLDLVDARGRPAAVPARLPLMDLEARVAAAVGAGGGRRAVP